MSRDNLYQATRTRVSDTVFLRLLSIHTEKVRAQRHMNTGCATDSAGVILAVTGRGLLR